jgi:hypothetical protein
LGFRARFCKRFYSPLGNLQLLLTRLLNLMKKLVFLMGWVSGAAFRMTKNRFANRFWETMGTSRKIFLQNKRKKCPKALGRSFSG